MQKSLWYTLVAICRPFTIKVIKSDQQLVLSKTNSTTMFLNVPHDIFKAEDAATQMASINHIE